MTEDQKTAALNDAVATATSLPDLVDKASTIDPALAAALAGKALLASKTPWGVLLTSGIVMIVSKYGLGWNEHFCELLSGVTILGASYAMRYWSPGRITGIFKKKPVV